MISLRTILAVTIAIPLLLMPSASAQGSHYTPRVGDNFRYYEVITLNGGTGNYTGYTEHTYVNGSMRIMSLQPQNGVAAASYYYSWKWHNSTGSRLSGNSSGSFTFSYDTFLYVNGTDNQTGYYRPSVWFYIDNTLGPSGTFYLLNTRMTVVSTARSYYLPSSHGYVKTIFAEGSGSYQRNDVYGVFNASYRWDNYFDPSTGYIVAYVYTEHDTGASGNGFTYTDTLYVTSTSYALTPAAAPSAPLPLNSGTLALLLVGALAAVAVVSVVFLRRRRRKGNEPLPQHPAYGNVSYGRSAAEHPPQPPDVQAHSPPPISFNPEQPPVQQIVIKEVVKVKCRYCGTLIDSTAQVCPACGAPLG